MQNLSGMTKKSVISITFKGGYATAVNQAVVAAILARLNVVVPARSGYVNAANISPASASGAIAVGSTNTIDYKSTFSNWGSTLSLFGSGENIEGPSNLCDNCYLTLSNTNMGEY